MSDTVSEEFGEEGGWRIANLTVDPADGGTVAVLTVISPLGVSTLPTVSGTLGNTAWASTPYELTSAGEWLERWQVTGTGKSKKRAVLRVAPDPFITPSGARVYATTADYAAHLVATTPAGARRALLEASRDIEKLLLCAVYPVDANLKPTDAEHIKAFRDATCMQAEYLRENSDEFGVGAAQYHQMSIATINLTRAYGQSGSAAPGRYSARAIDRLQAAGLNTVGPESW